MSEAFHDDPGVQLMLRYQRGDEAAFDEIVLENSARIYALLTRFLGTRAGREDLVQDVFLRVIRARERYQPTARFSTWLYRIVFNLAVNETQRAGAKESAAGAARAVEAGLPGGVEFMSDPNQQDPSDGLAQNDVVSAVRRAIGELPENQRMAVILAKYHEMPYDEIAEVLGSSEKAVKSLVHRARENLRATLAPYLQGERA